MTQNIGVVWFFARPTSSLSLRRCRLIKLFANFPVAGKHNQPRSARWGHGFWTGWIKIGKRAIAIAWATGAAPNRIHWKFSGHWVFSLELRNEKKDFWDPVDRIGMCYSSRLKESRDKGHLYQVTSTPLHWITYIVGKLWSCNVVGLRLKLWRSSGSGGAFLKKMEQNVHLL